jgi:hypothetical protein
VTSIIPKRYQDVGDNVGDTEPKGRERVLRNNVLQNHDGDTSSKATSHSSKAHEQDNAGLPGDTIAAVAEVISGEAGLIDRVDDEHAEGAEDDGDPVDKGHMHVGAIERGLGVNCGIDEDKEGDGKL